MRIFRSYWLDDKRFDQPSFAACFTVRISNLFLNQNAKIFLSCPTFDGVGVAKDVAKDVTTGACLLTKTQSTSKSDQKELQ